MNDSKIANKLLIIEDDEDLRALLNHYLKDLVCETHQACDGTEALQIIKEHDFDTILSDIEMPHINGLRLLAYVRSLGKLTPFIVLTAHDNYENVQEALSLGAFDFIAKGAKRKDILDSVSYALELGKKINHAKNDNDLTNQLKKIYNDEVNRSEMRLRKIIDAKKSTF